MLKARRYLLNLEHVVYAWEITEMPDNGTRTAVAAQVIDNAHYIGVTPSLHWSYALELKLLNFKK